MLACNLLQHGIELGHYRSRWGFSFRFCGKRIVNHDLESVCSRANAECRYERRAASKVHDGRPKCCSGRMSEEGKKRLVRVLIGKEAHNMTGP